MKTLINYANFPESRLFSQAQCLLIERNLKAAIIVMKEFFKAATTHIKVFLKSTEIDNFLQISSQSFWRLL
jgi:hypothetical protein